MRPKASEKRPARESQQRPSGVSSTHPRTELLYPLSALYTLRERTEEEADIELDGSDCEPGSVQFTHADRGASRKDPGGLRGVLVVDLAWSVRRE